MDLMKHYTANNSLELARHEIRHLVLSILSNHDDTKNLIRVSDVQPVDEIMGFIQKVSIKPHDSQRKAHSSRNYSTQ